MSSLVENAFEEHGLTEDDKTVAPFSRISVPIKHNSDLSRLFAAVVRCWDRVKFKDFFQSSHHRSA